MIKLGRVSVETRGTPLIGRVEDYEFCMPGQNEVAKPGCGA